MVCAGLLRSSPFSRPMVLPPGWCCGRRAQLDVNAPVVQIDLRDLPLPSASDHASEPAPLTNRLCDRRCVSPSTFTSSQAARCQRILRDLFGLIMIAAVVAVTPCTPLGLDSCRAVAAQRYRVSAVARQRIRVRSRS
jgi:hypothetical protein